MQKYSFVYIVMVYKYTVMMYKSNSFVYTYDYVLIILHAEIARDSLTNLIILGIESFCVHYDYVFITCRSISLCIQLRCTNRIPLCSLMTMYLLHAEIAGGSLTNWITLGCESLCVHYDYVFITCRSISLCIQLWCTNTQSQCKYRILLCTLRRWGGYDQQAPSNYWSHLQNIVSLIGLFCKRDL